MPTTYLPQRLIHAHLPSTPTNPTEIQIPVITDREFPTTDETEEPLSPGHATSTILEPTTGILARVTHNGYLLILQNFALTTPAHSSSSRLSINIAFPDKLRPLGEGCIIPYPEDGRVYMLLLTENDVVYRLKLSMVMNGDRLELTTKGMDTWCEEWEVPEETLVACGGVGAWRVIDEDTIVLGGGDGGIVRLTRAGKWGRGLSTPLSTDCANDQEQAGLQVIKDQHRNSDYHQSFLVPPHPMNLSFRQPSTPKHPALRYIPSREITSSGLGTRLLEVYFVHSISDLHSLPPRTWLFEEHILPLPTIPSSCPI